MKIKEIAKLAKKTGKLVLYNQEEGCQWVDVGGAIYPLHGLPELDIRTLPKVLDLSDKEMEKITISADPIPRVIDFSSYASDEDAAPDPLITLGIGDKVLYPVETSEGLMFYNPMYLWPVKDENYEVFVRKTTSNYPYFAIQHGTFLVAVIFPVKIETADLYNRINQLETMLSLRMASEREADTMKNFKLDEETGEIIEEE